MSCDLIVDIFIASNIVQLKAALQILKFHLIYCKVFTGLQIIV